MPRFAILPTAGEFFTKVCVIKRRPTRPAIGTEEVALERDVHQQTLWNKAGRGQMPPAEDPRLYRRPGNRKLYRLDNVLTWRPGGEGVEPWDWARRFLGAAWYIPPDRLADKEHMLEWIGEVERKRWTSSPWRWRSVERGILALREAYA